MSTGGWIGAVVGLVVGAVIGFYIGGPGGALVGGLYGMSLGFAAGMYIDPMTPDVPSTTAPLPAGAEVMTTVVGDPLPDLTGTAKITGHLLCFGKERTETVYAESGGGSKGGGSSPDPQVSGYKYYMSWAVGIVAGPIDALYAIYKNNDVVWEGNLTLPSDSFGQETIVLDGMGSATFYFGTDDQIANTNVGEIIGDDTLNSPYRHFCWCFLDDCYIGDYNRAPTMKFILRKSPAVAFSEDSGVIQIYDYNPMHSIWYILHDLVGLPETWSHSDDFAAAAITLADEDRGISCLLVSQQSAVSYLESINGHIDGIIRYGSDGKFHPKLIRDDYTIDDLPLIDENVMLDDPTLKRKSWIDTVNEVRVQYTEILAAHFEFLQGPWRAAMSPVGSSVVYVYDETYKSVIKLSTETLPPVCDDAIVITEHELDYGETQRGGYCMSPDGTRLWYLTRNGLDCVLIEVDITGYYIKIAKKTTFPSLLTSGETITDGGSDGTYTYWSTSLIAGRVIEIKNSDHSLSLDVTFNYPIVAMGCGNTSIVSLTVEGSYIYWIYARDHMASGADPYANACWHWIKSGNDLVQELDVKDCGSGGGGVPYWLNLIRCIDEHMFIHKHYSGGPLYLTNKLFDIRAIACVKRLRNVLGIEDNVVYILTGDGMYESCLKRLSLTALTYLDTLSELDTSTFTGSLKGGDTELFTSIISTYGSIRAMTLFRYDETNKVNILTSFRANESLTKLSEGIVYSKGRMPYGD